MKFKLHFDQMVALEEEFRAQQSYYSSSSGGHERLYHISLPSIW